MDKFRKGDYVICVKSFWTTSTSDPYLKVGTIYQILEYKRSPQGGVDGFDGIITVLDEKGKESPYTSNYFILK